MFFYKSWKLKLQPILIRNGSMTLLYRVSTVFINVNRCIWSFTENNFFVINMVYITGFKYLNLKDQYSNILCRYKFTIYMYFARPTFLKVRIRCIVVESFEFGTFTLYRYPYNLCRCRDLRIIIYVQSHTYLCRVFRAGHRHNFAKIQGVQT